MQLAAAALISHLATSSRNVLEHGSEGKKKRINKKDAQMLKQRRLLVVYLFCQHSGMKMHDGLNMEQGVA